MPAAMGQVADQSSRSAEAVVDSISRDGEPYATISITRKEKPGKAVKMAVTDKDGRFSETMSGKGSFVITISSIGAKP